MINFFYNFFIFYLIISALLGLGIGRFIHLFIDYIPLLLSRNWHKQRTESICYSTHFLMPIKFNLSVQKNLVIIFTSLLFIITFYYASFTVTTVARLYFESTLILLAAIDIKYFLLPDCLTLSLIWLGLIANTFNLFTPANDAIIAASLGYIMLWLIGFTYHFFSGKAGMGKGDYKLFAAIGAWLGTDSLLLVALIATTLGLLISGIAILTKHKTYHSPLPFGAYLAAAGFFLMFLQTLAVHWNLFDFFSY